MPIPPFTVIGESAEWIAVDKPPFLQVHPKKPGGPPTLWDGLRGLLAYELALGGQVSLINRLDRETSGVVLAAKTAAAARRFHEAMKRRAFAKEYIALVYGWPERDAFTVEAPILRQGERLPSAIYLKRCVHPEGAEAVTRFVVEARLEKPTPEGGSGRFARIRAFPATGRTHQIRVHLAHAGHPLVGDKIYGPYEQCYLEFIETGWSAALERRLLLPRHALHSERLRVELEGEVFDWRAPLPPDLRQFWEGLRAG